MERERDGEGGKMKTTRGSAFVGIVIHPNIHSHPPKYSGIRERDKEKDERKIRREKR